MHLVGPAGGLDRLLVGHPRAGGVRRREYRASSVHGAEDLRELVVTGSIELGSTRASCFHAAGRRLIPGSRYTNFTMASAGPNTARFRSFHRHDIEAGHQVLRDVIGTSATATVAQLGAACMTRSHTDVAVDRDGQGEDASQSGDNMVADAVHGQRRRAKRRTTQPPPRRVLNYEEHGLGMIIGAEVRCSPL